MFLWHGRNWARKALEAAITPVMELVWTKRRILDVYLNVAEFGEGIFGVEAAARHYLRRERGRSVGGAGGAAGGRAARPEGPQRGRSVALRAQPGAGDHSAGPKPIRADGRAACFERSGRRNDAAAGLNSAVAAGAKRADVFTDPECADEPTVPRRRFRPFCRKVRLTLAEKKIEVELVEERYWEPAPDFLRRNPAGKVPVLRLDTG